MKNKTKNKTDLLRVILVFAVLLLGGWFLSKNVLAIDTATTEMLLSHEFQGGGERKNLSGSNVSYSYDLPFPVAMFGETVTKMNIHVGKDGVAITPLTQAEDPIDYVIYSYNGSNLFLSLDQHPEDDVYITENQDNVIIRVQAGSLNSPSDVFNVETIVYRDGRFKFNFGENTDRGIPITVGFYNFKGGTSLFSQLSGQTNFNNVQTSAWGDFHVSVTSLNPINNSNAVGLQPTLSLTFDGVAEKGNGNIILKKYDDDSVVESVSVDSPQVTGWGTNTISVALSSELSYNTKYYVNVDDTAVNLFPGISDKTTWHFTTRPEGNNFTFADDFNNQDFIDDDQTDAHYDESQGAYTLVSQIGSWSHADKTTLGKENIYHASDYARYPKLALDQQGRPMAVWQDDNKIYFTRWNGSAWTTMSGADGSEDISSVAANCTGGGTSCLRSRVPQIITDNNGYPIVLWHGYNSDSNSNNLYIRKWNGSAWTTMDGSVTGAERPFGNVEVIYYDDGINTFQITKNSQGNPMVVGIMNDGAGHQFPIYTEWNGSSWRGKGGGAYDVIYGDSSTVANDVVLSRDDNDTPMVVWGDNAGTNNGVFFNYWNGSAWRGLENNSANNRDTIFGYAYDILPVLRINSQNHPLVAYQNNLGGPNPGIGVKSWNGSDWVQIGYDQASPLRVIRMELDGSDNPILAWLDDNAGDILVSKRTDDWHGLGGSNSYDTIDVEAGASLSDLKLKINSQNQPLIVWSASQWFSTHFTYWNGSAWSGADGSSADDNLSGHVRTGEIDLVIDSEDEPFVVWQENSTGDIFFSVLPISVQSPLTVQSKKINGDINDIEKATLTADAILNGQSYIDYYLSNDGGNNWTKVDSGEAVTFSNLGNDLRWRAMLYKGSMPVLNGVQINYSSHSPSNTGGSSSTPPDEEESEETECKTIGVKELNTNSVKLRVEVDPSFSHEKQKFRVTVKNLLNGSERKVEIKKRPSAAGRVSLFIDGLESGAKYELKVKHKTNSDTYEYCPHKKNIEVPEKKKDYNLSLPPLCGAGAGEYSSADTTFQGALCENGEVVNEPDFPAPGQTVHWECEKEGEKVECQAKRKKEEVKQEEERKRETEKISFPGTSEPKSQSPSPNPVAKISTLVGLVALGLAGIPLASPTSHFSLLALFAFPFTKRRKTKDWGVIFDEETKQPLKKVPIKLQEMNSGKVVATTFSDEQGRYGFLISQKGKYGLLVKLKNYSLDTSHPEDPLYGKLYTHPQEIDPASVEELNLALKQEKINWHEYLRSFDQRRLLHKVLNFIFYGIFILGAIYSLQVTIKYPHWFNYLVLAVYGFTIIYLLARGFRKKFGTLRNQAGKPIPLAVVELYQDNQRKYFTVTDLEGRYYLLAKNGHYTLKIKGQPISGHTFSFEKEIDIKDGILKRDFKIIE